MILFDLACPDGHVFEGWFGSTADYDDQQARGLVTCPLCGAGDVAKAMMAPRVSGTGPNDPPTPMQMKAMLGQLARAQAKALEGSEHVGRRFAAEARAMHDGDKPERPIHGQATLAEARDLAADGVPVAPLPLPLRPPGADN